jgi:hypothetical protein
VLSSSTSASASHWGAVVPSALSLLVDWSKAISPHRRFSLDPIQTPRRLRLLLSLRTGGVNVAFAAAEERRSHTRTTRPACIIDGAGGKMWHDWVPIDYICVPHVILVLLCPPQPSAPVFPTSCLLSRPHSTACKARRNILDHSRASLPTPATQGGP